ncbi:MAG: BREX-3 system P-loop-containing protein BrxF [Ruthenibacterium sp.]
MGVIIAARKFSPQNQAGLLKPIVYCCPFEGVTEQAVSLNLELAQALKVFKPKRRTMQIERCFADILAKLPDGVVLKDFDVLFNPDYKVDVLIIMVNTCKVKPFSIIWTGSFDGSRLIYAEEGYEDYKTYDVKDYDITCIV